MTLHKDFQELLSALNAHHAEYLLVGGYAVGVHSEPRATKDLDIWIKPDPQNSIAVFRALAAFGAPLAGFSPDDFNDAPRSIFQMGSPPYASTSFKPLTASASMKPGEPESKLGSMTSPSMSSLLRC